MRRFILGTGLLALAACQSGLPDQVYPVFFVEFSANLDQAGLAVVNDAATLAKKYPRARVKVTGYADQIGTNAQVVALSKARADAVAGLLLQDGIEAGRIVRDAVGTPSNTQPGVERRRVDIDIVL